VPLIEEGAPADIVAFDVDPLLEPDALRTRPGSSCGVAC
jgi:imidazolonepropionase-like amidohydrolase